MATTAITIVKTGHHCNAVSGTREKINEKWERQLN